MRATCSIQDCSGLVVGRGWCRKHYSRWQRHGDPFVVLQHKPWRADTAAPDLPGLRTAHNRDLQKKGVQDRKWAIIQHYGGACSCCGETALVFLAIDHVHGGGTRHRREVGDIYTRLRRNNFPAGFQVLCHNCNWAKSHGGCPHRQKLVAV